MRFTALKILHDLRLQELRHHHSAARRQRGARLARLHQLIKSLARGNSDVEFNMEPGDPPDALTVWRKGSAGIRIQVKGRAAHAGMAPQDGRNAAVELVHQLSALEGAFPAFRRRHDGQPDRHEGRRAQQHHPRLSPRRRSTSATASPEDFDAVLARVEAGADHHSGPGHHGDGLARSGLSAADRKPAIDALAARAQAIYAEIGKTVQLVGQWRRVGVRAGHG
jgi:glutamate carboxypeptidase